MFYFNPLYDSSVVHYTSSHIPIAEGDSGATRHYITPQHSTFLHDVKNIRFGPTVQLPNNALLQANATGTLPFDANLPDAATYILPSLHTSLLSLGQLADANCKILLDKYKLEVFHNFKRIFLDIVINLMVCVTFL